MVLSLLYSRAGPLKPAGVSFTTYDDKEVMNGLK